MIDPRDFRRRIIRPTLGYLGLYSRAAENLLLATAKQESGLTWLRQIGGGPGRGVYQCEPATHADIWGRYLYYRPDLAAKVRALASGFSAVDPDLDLEGNLFYATAICRVHYLRVWAPLPNENDDIGMASYWKRYYNTPEGKGTVEQFYLNYERFIA